MRTYSQLQNPLIHVYELGRNKKNSLSFTYVYAFRPDPPRGGSRAGQKSGQNETPSPKDFFRLEGHIKAILQVLIYKASYDKSYLGSKTTMTSGEWTCLISFATAPLTCS